MRKSEIHKTLVDNEAGDKLNSVIEKTEKEREERARFFKEATTAIM